MIKDLFSEFSKAAAIAEDNSELSNELDLYLMEKIKQTTKSTLGAKLDIFL